MAAVPITINGVICDLYGRTITGPVKIVGELVRSDVGIGGGPIIPPPGDKPPGSPPGIWPGPGDPDFPGGGYHPAHPIVLPPIIPGGPPINIGAHPEHPIVLPPPPDTTPPPPGMAVKPPPDSGGWAYVQPWGWGYFPTGSTTPGPKA